LIIYAQFSNGFQTNSPSHSSSFVFHAAVTAGTALVDTHEPIYSSPLVSWQQLTVLREETHHYPRAFSFSGHTQESPRLREVRSRESWLCDGRDRGRFSGRSDAANLPLDGDESFRGDLFHRPHSAPGRHYDQISAVDDMAGIDSRHGRRTESQYHESWPQRFSANSSRRPYDTLASLQGSAPQFYPIQAEDVAAHGSFPDTDTIMAEVANVRVRGRPSQMTHWSEPKITSQASPRMQYPPRPGVSSSSRRFPSPPPVLSPQQAPAIHRRSDSTASATVIVAQLASAMHEEPLAQDDNPYEPIPLGGRSKEKGKRE
jgi:hypothetical protein